MTFGVEGVDCQTFRVYRLFWITNWQDQISINFDTISQIHRVAIILLA